MAQTISRLETSLLVLRLRPAIQMDDEQFFQFCGLNNELRIERTAEGDLEIQRPTGGATGGQNSILTYQLTGWALRDGTGKAYDSSTGYNLPNGATRSPDASWVRKSRLEALTPEQVSGEPELPGFTLDLRMIWGDPS